MIAVIFEVAPEEGKNDEYLDIARSLKSELEVIPGFISIERFQSLVDPRKILSLSFWKDEDSIKEWRNRTTHRKAQQAGRNSVFEDYRLRVASVIRDYGMSERQEAPADNIF
ncbi:antibiotic biosynthesis monooxygenase [Chryseobacterium cucumeris]|uniref:Antibiotic biosynthesis monooxygenase n=1 Tax=Chryseobacterium cucumeris TaxID=1813611 RepID=A0ABX9X0D4_9FLAO|nr:antibiotic biosynthesis monooxygenase [Chryseobacterium cucumeris]ROH87507.1 antibiotic biosynthesis monooxygenase [Chryseobacterium cucumeris]